MQMTGEQHVAAPRRDVWAALNDPAVLAKCIPGCQSLEREGEDRFLAVAEVRIGPIGARFRGEVQLSDLDPPSGYTITGSGNGGIAGSAKGGAKVRLHDGEDGGTRIAYEVEAEVGGRMAQLGGPIIDATARNLAAKFFATFSAIVTGEEETGTPQVTQALGGGPAAAAAAIPATPQAAMTSGASNGPARDHAQDRVGGGIPASGGMPWGWIAALVLALLAGFALGMRDQAQVMLMVLVLLVVSAAAGFEAGRRSGGGQ